MHACCNFFVAKNQSPSIQKSALNQFKSFTQTQENDKEAQCILHAQQNIFSVFWTEFSYSQFLSPCYLSPSSSRKPEKFSLTMTPKILFSSTKCPQLFLNSAQRVLFFLPRVCQSSQRLKNCSLSAFPPTTLHLHTVVKVVAFTTPHHQPPSRLQRVASPSQENQGSVLASSLSDLTEGSL